MSFLTIRMTAPTVVMLSSRRSMRAPLVAGVLLDNPVQIGIDVHQRGDHHGGQTGKVAAVEPAEGVAEVADR